MKKPSTEGFFYSGSFFSLTVTMSSMTPTTIANAVYGAIAMMPAVMAKKAATARITHRVTHMLIYP